MYHTHARPSRDLRNNYAEVVQLVKEQHDQVIITNNGRDEAVLIGIEEFRAYENFLHQRYIAEELAQAKIEASDPKTQWLDHNEVWQAARERYAVSN
ncbi:MAG: type II toxin-antitoxin system Phd/YefM family antitoxin [Coriobacteriales bacterium]|jgi:prevent-host-death family protein|nr:type II toxin-antitoxin system Phd/YefM family antitoxin [Coriobacteriales bacterium]